MSPPFTTTRDLQHEATGSTSSHGRTETDLRLRNARVGATKAFHQGVTLVRNIGSMITASPISRRSHHEEHATVELSVMPRGRSAPSAAGAVTRPSTLPVTGTVESTHGIQSGLDTEASRLAVQALRANLVSLLREVSAQTYGPKSAIPSCAHATLSRNMTATGETTNLVVEVPDDLEDDSRVKHLRDRFRGVQAGENTRSPSGAEGLGFLADDNEGVDAEQMTDVELIHFETPMLVDGRRSTLALCQRRGEYALMTFIVPSEANERGAAEDDLRKPEDDSPWCDVTAITTLARLTIGGPGTAEWISKARTEKRVDWLGVQLLHEMTPDRPSPPSQASVATVSTADRFFRFERPVSVAEAPVCDLLLHWKGKHVATRQTGTDSEPKTVSIPVEMTYFTEKIPMLRDRAQKEAWLQEVAQLASALQASLDGVPESHEATASGVRTARHGEQAAHAGTAGDAAHHDERISRSRVSQNAGCSHRIPAHSEAGTRSRSRPRLSSFVADKWHRRFHLARTSHREADNGESGAVSSRTTAPRRAADNVSSND